MPRTPLWQSIATTLSNEISQGLYAPGSKLPSEAKLAARFGVNRHTVRQAVGVLADDGMLLPRRGAGVFVQQTPTQYPMGRRVRYHQNLTAQGHVPGKEILSLETRNASEREIDALNLTTGAQVHVYDGLSLSDGQTIAQFRSVFPAERFPGFLNDLTETRSVTQALARHGVQDYTRSMTHITATRAKTMQAQHLHLREGDPLLRTVSVNVDTDGTPIEFGHTWFAGDRVTLTFEPD